MRRLVDEPHRDELPTKLQMNRCDRVICRHFSVSTVLKFFECLENEVLFLTSSYWHVGDLLTSKSTDFRDDSHR